MQEPGRGAVRPPIGIAFDGDLGNRIDAMLAVAMLNGFTAKTEARRISLSVSRPSLVSAQLADVSPRSTEAVRPAALAAACRRDHRGHDRHAGRRRLRPTTSQLSPRRSSKKTADGTPDYTSAITSLIDTAESAILIRNLLLAQHDGNAAIVLAGPATGVVRMLGLYRVGPADHREVQAAGRCRRIVSGRSARARDQEPTSPPHGSSSPSGRRRSWRSGRKSETRCRTRARASRRTSPGRRRIRWSTRTARSSRCPTTRRHPRWRQCFMPFIPKTATSRCPIPERSRCRMTAERALRRERTASTGT